uniref:Uncharacterized protein n=1 Tax=Cacopsylla melanoneura TaxID=428564 RepID=A0A8D8SL96_9HEMI
MDQKNLTIINIIHQSNKSNKEPDEILFTNIIYRELYRVVFKKKVMRKIRVSLLYQRCSGNALKMFKSYLHNSVPGYGISCLTIISDDNTKILGMNLLPRLFWFK